MFYKQEFTDFKLAFSLISVFLCTQLDLLIEHQHTILFGKSISTNNFYSYMPYLISLQKLQKSSRLFW